MRAFRPFLPNSKLHSKARHAESFLPFEQSLQRPQPMTPQPLPNGRRHTIITVLGASNASVLPQVWRHAFPSPGNKTSPFDPDESAQAIEESFAHNTGTRQSVSGLFAPSTRIHAKLPTARGGSPPPRKIRSGFSEKCRSVLYSLNCASRIRNARTPENPKGITFTLRRFVESNENNAASCTDGN